MVVVCACVMPYNAICVNDPVIPNGTVVRSIDVYTIYVVDRSGEPIVGASILVKGTNAGTITNIDGIGILQAKAGKKIEVTYIGYKMVTYLLSSSSHIIIIMEDDVESLKE